MCEFGETIFTMSGYYYPEKGEHDKGYTKTLTLMKLQ